MNLDYRLLDDLLDLARDLVKNPPMASVDNFAGGQQRCVYCTSAYRDTHWERCPVYEALQILAEAAKR